MMPAEYEETGKYFTDVIPKKPVEVLIQTTHQLLRGFIHVRSDYRLKDEIDEPGASLAVTDVTVYGDTGTALYHANFLALSRTQIVWIIPYEELVE